MAERAGFVPVAGRWYTSVGEAGTAAGQPALPTSFVLLTVDRSCKHYENYPPIVSACVPMHAHFSHFLRLLHAHAPTFVFNWTVHAQPQVRNNVCTKFLLLDKASA